MPKQHEHTPDQRDYNALAIFVAVVADGPCLDTGGEGCECVTHLAQRLLASPTIEGRQEISRWVTSLHGGSIVDLTRRLGDVTAQYHTLTNDYRVLAAAYSAMAEREQQERLRPPTADRPDAPPTGETPTVPPQP